MDLKWLTPMDEGEFNAFWRSILPVNFYAAQKFLVDYFDMDPGKHKLWPELESLYQIRNCYAHNRGLLGEPADEGVAPTKAQKRDAIIRKYAAQHPERLFIGSDGHAQPSRELCVHALKTVETFLNRVIDEGRLWLGRWNESQGIKSERTVRVRYLTPRVPFQSDDR